MRKMKPAGRSLPAHIATGKMGERYACEFLLNAGYELLNANWQSDHHEIDLVLRGGNEIVFVEVKTRSTPAYGGGAAAVTARKRHNLALAAQAWLYEHELWEAPCRFDVICLTGKKGNFKVEHFRNAFETGETMGCGDAAWQSGGFFAKGGESA